MADFDVWCIFNCMLQSLLHYQCCYCCLLLRFSALDLINIIPLQRIYMSFCMRIRVVDHNPVGNYTHFTQPSRKFDTFRVFWLTYIHIAIYLLYLNLCRYNLCKISIQHIFVKLKFHVIYWVWELVIWHVKFKG